MDFFCHVYKKTMPSIFSFCLHYFSVINHLNNFKCLLSAQFATLCVNLHFFTNKISSMDFNYSGNIAPPTRLVDFEHTSAITQISFAF